MRVSCIEARRGRTGAHPYSCAPMFADRSAIRHTPNDGPWVYSMLEVRRRMIRFVIQCVAKVLKIDAN
jgi:hypothetical protein